MTIFDEKLLNNVKIHDLIQAKVKIYIGHKVLHENAIKLTPKMTV